MNARIVSLVSAALAVSLVACRLDAQDACLPGRSELCACTDGRPGAQVCRDDRTFDECRCSGDLPPPGASPGPDALGAVPSCNDGGPGEMALVPASELTMGCNEAVDPICAMGLRSESDDECNAEEDVAWFEQCPYADEFPAHRVSVSTFEIDRTEVTQAQYAACVAAGLCAVPRWVSPDYDPVLTPDLPVALDESSNAGAYCAFVGKRLPTEAEWELAARWLDGRIFPWGNDAFDCSRANIASCHDNAVPVGTTPGDRSPCGVMDMAGNVREYVADGYDPQAYRFSPSDNPLLEPFSDWRAMRGGYWRSEPSEARTSYRRAELEGVAYDDAMPGGFRCARSVP